MIHSLFFVCFLIGAALGTTTVPIPDNDPFYKPPAGFESSAPGTVFSNRSVSSGTEGVTAVQVLYRTTLIDGTATATVATILTGPASTGMKLVSYADHVDALNKTCYDSYLYYTNNTGSSITLGLDTNGILAKGATVVVPDYDGLNPAFSAGRQEGYAVLDGLRAALNYAPAGLKKTATVGGYGYSGGAIPTGWAASLQPTYAPELNVKGWAFGGTPANVTSTFQNLDGTIFAGLSAGIIAGQIAAYPAAAERFAQILTAEGVAAIAAVKSQCLAADLLGFIFADFETSTYQTLGDQLLYDPVLASVLQNSTMGARKDETPTAPVYMFHGKSDEMVPYASAQATANAWCANGASVEFVTETGGTGHVGTMVAMFSNAAAWLDLRLGGTAPAAGCANASYFELGVPLRREDAREEVDAGGANSINATRTALETFGAGDSLVVGNMRALGAAGQAIPSLWSYLSWKL